MAEKHSISCGSCQGLFFPKREDARFCSAKCRKAANRKGVKAGRHDGQTEYALIQKYLFKLMGLERWGSLRSLVLLIIENMPDAQRGKLYSAIKSDIDRLSVTNSVTGNW